MRFATEALVACSLLWRNTSYAGKKIGEMPLSQKGISSLIGIMRLSVMFSFMFAATPSAEAQYAVVKKKR